MIFGSVLIGIGIIAIERENERIAWENFSHEIERIFGPEPEINGTLIELWYFSENHVYSIKGPQNFSRDANIIVGSLYTILWARVFGLTDATGRNLGPEDLYFVNFSIVSYPPDFAREINFIYLPVLEQSIAYDGRSIRISFIFDTMFLAELFHIS